MANNETKTYSPTGQKGIVMNLNDFVTFRNNLYPSLSGSVGKIVDLPDVDYDYYGVEFANGQRMACHAAELRLT